MKYQVLNETFNHLEQAKKAARESSSAQQRPIQVYRITDNVIVFTSEDGMVPQDFPDDDILAFGDSLSLTDNEFMLNEHYNKYA